MDNLKKLSSDAKLWIFPFSRCMSEVEKVRVEELVKSILATWKSHGRDIQSAVAIYRDRFLLVGAEISGEAPSGCSIDALHRRIPEALQNTGISLSDPASLIYFTEADGIKSMTRDDFRRYASGGNVTRSTSVFDNSIHTVKQLREGKWELPFEKSWHAQVFELPSGAGL